jgi:hypothetical protein
VPFNAYNSAKHNNTAPLRCKSSHIMSEQKPHPSLIVEEDKEDSELELKEYCKNATTADYHSNAFYNTNREHYQHRPCSHDIDMGRNWRTARHQRNTTSKTTFIDNERMHNSKLDSYEQLQPHFGKGHKFVDLPSANNTYNPIMISNKYESDTEYNTYKNEIYRTGSEYRAVSE